MSLLKGKPRGAGVAGGPRQDVLVLIPGILLWTLLPLFISLGVSERSEVGVFSVA